MHQNGGGIIWRELEDLHITLIGLGHLPLGT
jgi:2'-5' RNA ligase